MEAFKFDTTVLENGIIKIPEIAQFAHRSVEIFIVVKQPDSISTPDKSQSIEQFLEKWTGFIKGSEPDKNKFEYLQEKYL